ncbi:hypothetical protein C8J56DRAFT_1123754, partial [Mycena floridula]
TLLHLIYIHGFQGDDTTFQGSLAIASNATFPTDLQQHLASASLPLQRNIRVHSSLYPTYKSVKPIANATRNFLEWLSTQPPGPVIVLGHSMGGLLAAEAATSKSGAGRIVGMVAFDTPFLGMHPHVVLSGIASLFAKQETKDSEAPTESEMNDHPQVTIVNEKVVTDDWESFKQNLDTRPSLNSHSSSQLSAAPSRSPSPPGFLNRSIAFLTEHSNDPMVRWFKKHSDEPLSAGKRWVVEHFQFGICMFDPKGLSDRYGQLVSWNGSWVNYWTQTVPKPTDPALDETQEPSVVDNDRALVENGLADNLAITAAPLSPSVSDSKALKERAKQIKSLEKQQKKEAKQHKEKTKVRKGKHFIVLPTGLGQVLGGGEKWEKVFVRGVEDEVAAHCGLFIRGKNPEYDALIERVGQKILGWVEQL